jgi:two-component system LytT family response regulator
LDKLSTLPYIIFTTAYDQYAIRAFEMNALDYLLKPFDQDRFDEALNRVKRQMEQEQFDREKMENLFNHFHTEKRFLEHILVKESGKIIHVRVSDIYWIEAEIDYIRLHTRQGSYLANQSMNGIEKKLDPGYFVRVHRSAIVNMTSIREIHPWTSGRYKCHLINGDETILSRTGAKKLRHWMI